MDLDGVRRLALALPEVTERQSWERPAWFHARMIGRMWDDERVTVRVEDDGERQALVSQEPRVFSTTAHHEGSSLVLVSLDAVDEPALRELLEQSWWNAATPALRKRHPSLGPPR